MKSRTLRRGAAFAIVTSLTFSIALAQEAAPQLEEIVVTAAYREQGLQDVPVSISALTGDMITESALQKAEDIQFLVPNFSLTETGIGTNAFIRGIGSGINQAFEQSVGTYIDGVYFGRAQQWRAPFLDIERVEVLRGPQSILFGKNSVAGALNISTAKPTDDFEARLMASHEFEYNESIVEGMLSGPISERVRYRIAARARELNGHMWNATLEQDEPQREDWMVRGTLEFDISSDLIATLKAEVGNFDVTGRHIEIIERGTAALDGDRYGEALFLLFGPAGVGSDVLNVERDRVRSSNGDFSNNDLENVVLTLDWALGEHNLESITAYSNFEYDEFCDCDFTGAVIFGAALQEQYEQTSQEFRLTSPLGGKIDYIGGLYYQTSDHDYNDQIIVPANSILVPALGANGAAIQDTQAVRLATVENDVISAFAQVNWHITDTTTLQIGGRVTRDEREGARTLSIVAGDFSPLPAAQVSAPFVYAGGFGITSTNLVEYSQLPVPALSVPANAFLYYGFDNTTGAPCTAASDPTACSGELGALPVTGTREKTKFSPEVKFIWNATSDALWYLSWSEGFKSGSYDFRANNKNFYPDMETSFEFDDEEAQNVEIGGKFTLAEGAMELNFAAFHTEYDDLQISIFDGVLGFNVGNAASARVQGIEADMRWALTEHLTISAAAAYTDFRFSDFENGQCYFGQAPNTDLDGDGIPELCSYTGKSNQMVSDFQANFAFDVRIPVNNSLDVHAVFDAFYTDDYDASATFDPALIQDSYTMVNARLSLGDQEGRWQVALLAKNLTDEIVLSFGGDTPLAGSTFGRKSNYAFYRMGRQLSLQTSFNF